MKRKAAAAGMIAVLLLAGCGNMFTKEKDQHYRNPAKISHELPNSDNDSPVVEEKSSEIHYAKEVSDLADKVKGVKKSHVIVTGDTTLVGIETEGGSSSNENNPLRQKVYDAIKGNSHGRNAAITTNREKVEEIKELGLEIGRGRHDMKGKIYNKVGVLIGQIPPVKNHYKNGKMEDAKKEEGNQNRTDIYE
jgi:YhcN/YlaJ family sporulation lipoprotein